MIENNESNDYQKKFILRIYYANFVNLKIVFL